MFFNKRKFFKKSRLSNLIFINDIFIYKFQDYLSFKKNDLIINLFLPKNLNISLKNNFLCISIKSNFTKKNFLIGTYSSLIKNIILGFSKKYFKKLLIVGVGYKAVLIYNFLYLYLGFSHPIFYKIPSYVSLSVPSYTEIVISGVDKQKVNQVASIIRNFKIPDVYKGKGIRYLNEKLRFKDFKKK